MPEKLSLIQRFYRLSLPKQMLFLAVVFVTLVALLFAEENWRGQWKWKRYAKELKSRGVPVDFKDVIPAAVPDAENFAKTPFLADILKAGMDWQNSETNRWPKDAPLAKGRMYELREKPTDFLEFSHWGVLDLPALARAFDLVKNEDSPPADALSPALDPEARSAAARVILQSLQVYDPVFEELHGVKSRRYSRYDINYNVGNPAAVLLPHLVVLKDLTTTLQMKATSHLALGQTAEALNDIRLMVAVANSLRDEPTLVSHLVRCACFTITLATIWEGFYFEQWTEPQLAELQTLVGGYDFLDATRKALMAERGFGNGVIESLRQQRGAMSDVLGVGPGQPALGLFVKFTPRGWIYLEQLNYNRLFDEFLVTEKPSGSRRVDPYVLDTKEDEMASSLAGQGALKSIFGHRIFASMLLPAVSSVNRQGAKTQALSDLAVLGCAVQRHQLKEGSLPADLNDLSPSYLAQVPLDVVTGAPYRFENVEDGRYRLYSVGWNEDDDGGIPDRKVEQGDWVWQYAKP